MSSFSRYPLSVGRALLLLITLFAGTACQSFERRAKEKAAVFSSLDAPTQARLAAREIHVGDTADMVYIALGKPTEKQDNITADGRTSRWIYSVYWQEYQGTRLVGYRRDAVFDPVTKSYRVIYTPDYQPVYVPRIEDRIRITFVADRVTVVEQVEADSLPTENGAR